MLFINADDYGISSGVNSGTLKCIKTGVINSISIVPNGYAFENGIKKVLNKKIKKLSIHLNLIEQKPISPLNKVNKLINSKKELNLNPIKLVLIDLFFSKKTKKTLSNQIEIELDSQIKKVLKKIKKKNIMIGVDSHYHVHIVPFIFKIVLKLTKKYNIKYIRFPIENNLFGQFSFINLFEYIYNLPKTLIINFFAKYCKKKYFKNKKIIYNSKFYGTLFSGNFSKKKFIKALIFAKKFSDTEIVEIISHPGSVVSSERKKFSKKIPNIYFSKNRIEEKNTLSDKEVLKILKS